MVIVAGYLTVEAAERQNYVAGCVAIIRQARDTPGCLDFAITADLVDPSRVNIFERWESQAALEAFRGDGPAPDQDAAIQFAQVNEFDIAGSRSLT